MKHKAEQRARTISSRGFTLVEVMVATMVFSIGMMAVITMEFSALRAYSASKDLSVAMMLADRTIAVMDIESANWSQQELGSLAAGGAALPVYASAPTSPIEVNMLAEIVRNPWQWRRVTPQQVSERMERDTQAGRYCIYVRGGVNELALGGQDVEISSVTTRVTPLISSQVAVVYPTSTSNFAANDCLRLRCGDGVERDIITMLQPGGGATTVVPFLESCGARAVYAATLIKR